MDRYQAFIDNQWVSAESGDEIEVVNPATGRAFASVPHCSAAQADEALEIASRAQPVWQALPAPTRARYLFAIADKIEEKRALFETLLVQEQGKRRDEAAGEVSDTIAYLTYAAEAGRRIKGDIFPSDLPNEQLQIHKVPFGVTVGLCAYNYPLALIGRKVGPALVTGNTMVLKPHEATPVTAAAFCELLLDVDLPPGVINMVTGLGHDVGAALVKNPITQLITCTGSIRAGQEIARLAAENITALSLELGGKAPFIVLKGADLDAAAEAAVQSRFANCGQVCICSETVMVEDSIADALTEKLLAHTAKVRAGDPMRNAGMGPITTPEAHARISGIVEESLAAGAQCLSGGGRPDGAGFEQGNWFTPTVIGNVSADSPVVREEIFGPVLPVLRVSDYEEALSIANARNDGLSAYLWTKDVSVMMDAIRRLQTGTIFINKGISGYVQGYHNGHKRSGLGGEDGIHGIEGYLQKRTVYMAY